MCWSISHRSVEAVGVCDGENLVSGGEGVDCGLFDRRRCISLALSTTLPLFHHLSSEKNHAFCFGGSTALLDGWKPLSLPPRLKSPKRKVKQSISLSTHACLRFLVFLCICDVFASYDLAFDVCYCNRSPLIQFYFFLFLCLLRLFRSRGYRCSSYGSTNMKVHQRSTTMAIKVTRIFVAELNWFSLFVLSELEWLSNWLSLFIWTELI